MSNQCVEAIRAYTTAYHNLHGRLPNVRANNGWIRIPNMDKSLRPYEVTEMAARLERRAREDRPNRIVAEMAEEDTWGIRRDRERIDPDELRMAVQRARSAREEDNREHERLQFIERLRNDLRERQREEEENSVWDVRDELNARVQAQIQNEVKQVVLDDNNESRVKIMGWREHIRKDSMVMLFNKLFEKAGNSAFTMQRMMEHFIHFGRFDDEQDCDECDLRNEMESMYERIHELERDTNSYRDTISKKNAYIKKLKDINLKQKQEMNGLKKNSVIFSMDEF